VNQERPLAGYSALSAAFAACLAGALIAARAGGRELPERIDLRDVATIGVATHKVSRLITKARITSFVRAPFVVHEGDAGLGEVSEAPRGEGLRHAVGELLVCPHCISQWVAAGFVVGLVTAPRPTRVVASLYAAKSLADFLQLAYKAAEDHAT
jgi:hypothetical protein